jgi:hypothetical protein
MAVRLNSKVKKQERDLAIRSIKQAHGQEADKNVAAAIAAVAAAGHKQSSTEILTAHWQRFKFTMAFEALVCLRDYVIVIGIGTIFFMCFEREARLQRQRGDVEMNFIDAAFFSTVTATSVGYGHQIWPRSDGAKVFMIFYLIGSTTVVGSTMSKLSNMYLESKK